MSDSSRDAQLELTRLHRSFGPKSTTLYNMPIEIVNQVLEKLDPIDLLRIRKVCRNLRTCVDKFGNHFDEITFFLWANCFILVLDGIRVEYTNTDNGRSTVQYAKKKKVIEGESSMKVALRDLKTVLKHTSELRIISDGIINNNITSFIDVLKSMKCIKVKRILLKNFSFNDIVTILQYFDTKVLEHIELFGTDMKDQFESIICLDQWKCAKRCRFYGFMLENRHIEHLFHYQWFEIKLDDIAIHIAIKIRDNLMRRSTFQGCDIHCDTSKSNLIKIAKVFKPDYVGDYDFSIEYSIDNATFEIASNYPIGAFFVFRIRKIGNTLGSLL